MDKHYEILNILSEECAEVIQVISKIHRFGFDSCHPADPDKSNLYRLHEEVGDLLCMINLTITEGMLNEDLLENHAIAKMEKLRKWSNIFKQQQATEQPKPAKRKRQKRGNQK